MFLFLFLFSSCDKKDDVLPSANNQKLEIENKENLAEINDLSAKYEASIKESLDEPVPQGEEDVVAYTEKRIDYLFRQKVNSPAKIQSLSSRTLVDEKKLSDYLSKLSTKLVAIGNLEEGEKEFTAEYITGLQRVALDEVNLELSNDSSLTSDEKQIILENLTIATNMEVLQTKYMDDIVQYDSTTGRCNWWCRIKKRVACTSARLAAAAVCVSVAPTVAGVALCYAAKLGADWVCS